MNKEKISAFTLRIASSNGTQLIAILYDIYKEYEEEAVAAFGEGDIDTATECLKKCNEVLEHLQKDLNFSYKISKDLYALYDYAKRGIAKSIYLGNITGIDQAKTVMDSLGEAFKEIASEDESAPLMKNTQKVMAGATYGRYSLNENIMGDQSNRGFLA